MKQCDGQISIFDITTEEQICNFSGHHCNKHNIWAVADTLDDIGVCPHVCCRKCWIKNACGARCNGSYEQI